MSTTTENYGSGILSRDLRERLQNWAMTYDSPSPGDAGTDLSSYMLGETDLHPLAVFLLAFQTMIQTPIDLYEHLSAAHEDLFYRALFGTSFMQREDANVDEIPDHLPKSREGARRRIRTRGRIANVEDLAWVVRERFPDLWVVEHVTKSLRNQEMGYVISKVPEMSNGAPNYLLRSEQKLKLRELFREHGPLGEAFFSDVKPTFISFGLVLGDHPTVKPAEIISDFEKWNDENMLVGEGVAHLKLRLETYLSKWTDFKALNFLPENSVEDDYVSSDHGGILISKLIAEAPQGE